jgi:hypothetical protein
MALLVRRIMSKKRPGVDVTFAQTASLLSKTQNGLHAKRKEYKNISEQFH